MSNESLHERTPNAVTAPGKERENGLMMEYEKQNVLVLISADEEWRAVKEELRPNRVRTYPLGEWFPFDLKVSNKKSEVVFLQTGCGKIPAAAATQYALDQWSPRLIINLGTCGGFEGKVKTGDVLVVTKTVVYDICERSGHHEEQIAKYTTDLNLSWLPKPFPMNARPVVMASADQDLNPERIGELMEIYGAFAADWESGAIAYVGWKKNGVKCLIVRGVSDVLGTTGSEIYENPETFSRRVRVIMPGLLKALPEWIANADLEKDKNGSVEIVKIDLAGRIRGCLLGIAIGDALGAPFEHIWPGQNIKALDLAEGRINDFHPYMGYPLGSWTDDTGMTLASCRAFIEVSRTGKTVQECHKNAFLAWVGSKECRKPGRTVKYAAKYGKADVSSWSNGALMRISPVAIYAYINGFDLYEGASLAYEVARLTHGHPLATFPAVECVLALMSIFSTDKKVPEALSNPGHYCKNLEGDQFSRYGEYRKKRHVKIDELNPSTGLHMWRQVFERCLDLAEGSDWSAMPSFEEGILKTVNESFDRDTAGAVAGALLGAYWGDSGIPERWKLKVEKADTIVELADRLIQSQS